MGVGFVGRINPIRGAGRRAFKKKRGVCMGVPESITAANTGPGDAEAKLPKGLLGQTAMNGCQVNKV